MFSYIPTFYTSKSSSHILRGYIFKTWPGNQFLLQHFSICHWTEGWQSGHETKLTPGLCIFDGRPFINRLPPLLVIHSNAPRFRPLFLSIVSSDLVSLVLILSQFLHCFPLFFHLHGSFVILPGPCCSPPFTRLIYSSLSLFDQEALARLLGSVFPPFHLLPLFQKPFLFFLRRQAAYP